MRDTISESLQATCYRSSKTIRCCYDREHICIFAFRKSRTSIIIICTVEKKQFLEKAGIRSAASFEDGSKGLVCLHSAWCVGRDTPACACTVHGCVGRDTPACACTLHGCVGRDTPACACTVHGCVGRDTPACACTLHARRGAARECAWRCGVHAGGMRGWRGMLRGCNR